MCVCGGGSQSLPVSLPVSRMPAAPGEGAIAAAGFVDLADGGSQVEDGPVQVGRLAAGEHLAGEALEVGVVADVGEGPRAEVALEDAGHGGVEQGLRLPVDEKEDGAGHVLADPGQGFELFTRGRETSAA